ncbi:hypothetical protein [Phreatobacter sp.]|uniref:hypothetical protein n=1 Tax=Phreatobacter sp. TaxID=1966341 RepID=UPI003F6FF3C8
MREVSRTLDSAAAILKSAPDITIVDQLALKLNDAFDASVAAGTTDEFVSLCNRHPIHSYFLEDPYTRRAFEKPRGYAGDAVMLDYIYRPQAMNLSPMGRIIHQATIGLPNARSIIYRANLLASQIDRVAETTESPRILSVASGHMRELDRAGLGYKCEIWALDQDEESLFEASRSYQYITRLINAPVSDIVRKGLDERFSLIYSAGLFDYIPHKFGVALIRALYESLEEGGILIVGNFTRDSHGRGYMAGIMDWRLIYRNEHELYSMSEQAAPSAEIEVHRDEPGNVVYCRLLRRNETHVMTAARRLRR